MPTATEKMSSGPPASLQKRSASFPYRMTTTLPSHRAQSVAATISRSSALAPPEVPRSIELSSGAGRRPREDAQHIEVTTSTLGKGQVGHTNKKVTNDFVEDCPKQKIKRRKYKNSHLCIRLSKFKKKTETIEKM